MRNCAGSGRLALGSNSTNRGPVDQRFSQELDVLCRGGLAGEAKYLPALIRTVSHCPEACRGTNTYDLACLPLRRIT